MENHIDFILQEKFVLTWSQNRPSRLILPQREIFLWTEVIRRYSDPLERSYPKHFEQSVGILESEAKEIMIEWLMNGPFTSMIEDMDRFPFSVVDKVRDTIVAASLAKSSAERGF